jgi:hypothetical protein
VECADVKIDITIEDFYGEQDSMNKISGKKGKKHAEVPQTIQQSI